MNANGPSQDSRSSGSPEKGIVRYTHASPNWVRAISAPIARGIQSNNTKSSRSSICVRITKTYASFSRVLVLSAWENDVSSRLIDISKIYLAELSFPSLSSPGLFASSMKTRRKDIWVLGHIRCACFRRVLPLLFFLHLKVKLGAKFLLGSRIPNDCKIVNMNLPKQFACGEPSQDLLKALSPNIVFGKRNMRHPEIRFIVRGDSFSYTGNDLPNRLMEMGEFNRPNNRNVEHWMQTCEQSHPASLKRKRRCLMCQLLHKACQLGFIVVASNLIRKMRIGKHLGKVMDTKIVGQFCPKVFNRFSGVFVKKGNHSMHQVNNSFCPHCSTSALAGMYDAPARQATVASGQAVGMGSELLVS